MAPAALAGTGDVTQKTLPDGCVQLNGVGGCTNVDGIDGPGGVALSPNGRSVYTVASSSNQVAIFDRALATGVLTQKAGAAGTLGGATLNGVESIVVTPDGNSVYVAASSANAVTAIDRVPNTGALVAKTGTGSCVSETGAGGCQDGVALANLRELAVSPDGKSLYAAGGISDAVAIFDRDTTTGEITQKAGTAGCVSETGTSGSCQDGVALVTPNEVAVSADGKSVYAASDGSDSIAIFDRNTATGALTQKAGTAGCISTTGTSGSCLIGNAINGVRGIAISPDDKTVYTNSASPTDGVAIFDRDAATGALTQKPGTAGCLTESGSGCVDGEGLFFGLDVAVSPDGLSVYAAGTNNALAILDRDPVTGELSQRKTGTLGCISETGNGGNCQDGVDFVFPTAVAVSPDNTSVYVTAANSDGMAVLDREATSRTLTVSTTGAGSGSVTGPGIACPGDCVQNFADGTAVALAATPAAGSDFGGFSGDCSGTGGCALTMSAARNVTGNFVLEPPVPVDTTPPNTSITPPKAKIKTKGSKASVSIAFSSSEGGSSFACSVDGGTFAPCMSPKSFSAKVGKHSFAVRATDAAGNADATPATTAFTVVKKKKR